MKIDDLLDRPAEEGARWRGIELLDEAVAARVRIDNPSDLEAMHDFRVALRRLRALMKLFKGELGPRLDRRRRDLGEVADLTGEARDAEVQLEWLLARRAEVARSRRAAFDWLCGRLEERKRSGYALARRRAAERLDEVAPKLRRRLRRYAIELDAPRTASFAQAIARLVVEQGAALSDLLHAVQHATDEEIAHRARIAGKQLRYLLEPLDESQVAGAEARAAVKGLKKLQELLGELHDVHILGHLLDELANDAEPTRLKNGLLAIAELVHIRRDELHAALLQARGRLPDLGGVAERLRPPIEIERKYLLSAMPPVDGAESVEIEQGYLPGDRFRERLRMTKGADGKVAYARTIKAGSGLRRTELEDSCPEALFRSLWPLTAGKRVRKRRHTIAAGELTWEIDEFLGRALVLAEVELPSETTEAIPPAWLAPLIVREVTEEKAFSNEALAT